MRRLVGRPLVVAVCLVALTVGVGAGVIRSAYFKPPVPPVVAVVDLQAVVNGLTKRTDKERELQSKANELKAELEKKKAEIEGDQKVYDTMPAGPQKKQMGQQLVKKALQFKFDNEYADQFLDQMYGELLRELYDDIAGACKQLSAQNGYTMVMADDTNAQIPRSGRVEVTKAISLKRMLYVDPAHDVTQELIAMMNNQYAAGGGGKSAAAPAPAPTTAPAVPPKK